MYIAGNHRQGNPQTDSLLAMLELEHRVTIPWKGMNDITVCCMLPAFPTEEQQQQRDPNEIPLDDEEVPGEVHSIGLAITNRLIYVILLPLNASCCPYPSHSS